MDARGRGWPRTWGGAVLGLALAAVSCTGGRPPQGTAGPTGGAEPAGITPRSVAGLEALWTAPAEGAYTPVIAGDQVITVASGSLFAFPQSCTDPCAPTWTVELGAPAATPAVADGIVYVATIEPPGRLFAFDPSCATDGERCEPLWTSPRIGPVANTEVAPVIAGDTVYVAAEHGVFGFSASCASGPAPCGRPVFEGPVREGTAIAATPDRVFVGTFDGELSALDASCPRRCDPMWTRRMDGAILGLAVAGDRLYVGTTEGFEGTGRGLDVFSIGDCQTSGGDCAPLWTAEMTGDVVKIVPTSGAIFVQDFGGLYAFAVDCRSDGGDCQPTWTYRSAASPLATALPVVDGDLIFTGTRDAQILALASSCTGTCEPIWTGEVGPTGSVGVALAGDLVVANSDQGLTAFGLAGS